MTTTAGSRLLLTFDGYEAPAELLERIAAQRPAGMTLFRYANVQDPAQVRALCGQLQAAAQAAGLPALLICADQEGGQLQALAGTTPFPGNLALGAIGSSELAERVGAALGRELAAMGVNVNYAPVCDVNINPANPVIGARSLGEDPELVGRLAAALIRGMQSAGVAATAKHFPGHGDVAADTHHGVVSLPHSVERLEQVELAPFQAACAAGVRLVMSAHLAVPALTGDERLPATLSAEIMGDLLRNRLGFTGVTVSDAMLMGAIEQGDGLGPACLKAAQAGMDLLLLQHSPAQEAALYQELATALERGELEPSGHQAAVARVRELQSWLAGQPQPALELVGCAEHRQLAAEVAARALTLVRDEAGLLPLRLPPDARLAVVVPRPTDLTPADTSSYETADLAEAIRRYHPGAERHECAADPDAAEVAALRAHLAGCDLAVVATINAWQQPGQAALVRGLIADGVPTVVVALRLPYDLASFPEAPTFLCAYSILEPALAACAAALWGELTPSGRLPVSIPGLYPAGHAG